MHPPRDLSPLPVLLHVAALADPGQTPRPVYGDLLPPCNAGCPAVENIQAWLPRTGAASMSGHSGNWLSAIHGRVCYHPCERTCNRAEPGSSVSIHAVADRRLLAPRPATRTAARRLDFRQGNGHDGEHQRRRG